MKRMNLYHSAGVILYRIEKEEIQYLLLHYASGHWDFAKGKMEVGEAERQAALRELAEETGLTAQLDGTFLASYDYFFTDYDGQKAYKKCDFFLGQSDGGTVVLSDEHIGYEWLGYEAALAKITFDNGKGVLVKVRDYLIGR